MQPRSHYPKIQRWQLFDVKSDPDELKDLFGEPRQARRLAALKQKLSALQEELGDPLAKP